MAKQGRVIHVNYQKQIRELHAQGKSIRKIAAALSISRNTVRKYLAIPPEQELHPKILPFWANQLDWQEIRRRYATGIQINQLYDEYAPEGITLSTFYGRFREIRNDRPEPTIPMNHKAGEKVQIDYCDGIEIMDPLSCKILKTQLFVGVLPFSGYCFAEFSYDQKQASFLKSHERMWRFFGGVTPYVVIDNLKSGVHRAHIYDPQTNPTFCEFGNHYGFAVLPTRPRRPRDKGIVEANVQAIQKSFYQKHNRRTFTSLAELNSAMRAFLDEFNARIMKDHGVSRQERFQQEKDALLPVNKEWYDLREWTTAKVHPDCHIQVKHCFYSVPYQRVGQQVRVRISRGLVEIFDMDGDTITAHARSTGRGKRMTIDEHFPEERLQSSRFEIKQAKAKAFEIGPKTGELMEHMFASSRPLVHLRRAQGLLRIYGSDGIDVAAMEYAAGQCLTFSRYRLSFFRDCAKSYSKQRNRSRQMAPHREERSLCLQYNEPRGGH